MDCSIPNYVGIIRNHDGSDPYGPTGVMECHKGLFHVARLRGKSLFQTSWVLKVVFYLMMFFFVAS